MPDTCNMRMTPMSNQSGTRTPITSCQRLPTPYIFYIMVQVVLGRFAQVIHLYSLGLLKDRMD